jgi:hypothetical protein
VTEPGFLALALAVTCGPANTERKEGAEDQNPGNAVIAPQQLHCGLLRELFTQWGGATVWHSLALSGTNVVV